MLDFLKTYWGDTASVAGLIVSVIGFFWTVGAANKAKRAAELARDSAAEANKRLLHLDAITAIREAVAVLEEAKTLHRTQSWAFALERYSRAARLVNQARSAFADWSESQLVDLTGAVSQLRTIEKLVDSAVRRSQAPNAQIESLNSQLSTEIDKLSSLEGYLKQVDNRSA